VASLQERLQTALGQYDALGRPAERDAAMRRAIDAGTMAISYGTYMAYLRRAGKLAAADSILALQAERFPDNRQRPQYASNLAMDRQQFDEAEARARELLQASPNLQQWAHDRLSYVAGVRGKLRVSQREAREARRIQAERVGWSAEQREIAVELQEIQQRLVHGLVTQAAGGEALERLWRREVARRAGQPDDIPPYGAYIQWFARAGRPARGRQLLDEWRSKLTERQRAQRFTRYGLQVAEASVLLGEGKHQEAAALFATACEPFRGEFAVCEAFPDAADAYDREGQTDSALAHYERYTALQADRVGLDETWFAQAHRRAGELHEAKGNREKALEYYGKFVELWKDADPELQPVVSDVQQRMARLAGEQR
jgi:tetratricopeptide (TPR) repeat protein